MYTTRIMIRSLLILLFMCVTHTSAQERQEKRGWFTEVDRNNDGKLSKKEFPRPTFFERLDKDQDGFISHEEIKNRRTPKAADAGTANKKSVVYGLSRLHTMDIYRPEHPQSAPVMLYVHGGGWKGGDKSAVGKKPSFFTEQGWFFISVNYRLLPEGQHPKNVEDIARAIAWVHKKIAAYGGDPERIFLMGHSAGCHLVSLVATDERRLKKHQLGLDVVKGVVANDTQAYDVEKLMQRAKSETYKTTFGEDVATQRDASPMHFVQAGKSIPPFLVLYSRGMMIEAGNGAARKEVANRFKHALESAGSSAAIFDGTAYTHGQINRLIGVEGHPLSTTIMRFLKPLSAVEKPDPDAASGNP